jgi:hypothetical protein
MPASRHQDHTTSPSAIAAFVSCAVRVHRIPHPTFVTTAKRPSCGRGTRESMPVICPTAQLYAPATNWHDGQITCCAENRVKRKLACLGSNWPNMRTQSTSGVAKLRTPVCRRYLPEARASKSSSQVALQGVMQVRGGEGCVPGAHRDLMQIRYDVADRVKPGHIGFLVLIDDQASDAVLSRSECRC